MNLKENLGVDILRESDSFLLVQGYQGDKKGILEVFRSVLISTVFQYRPDFTYRYVRQTLRLLTEKIIGRN